MGKYDNYSVNNNSMGDNLGFLIGDEIAEEPHRRDPNEPKIHNTDDQTISIGDITKKINGVPMYDNLIESWQLICKTLLAFLEDIELGTSNSFKLKLKTGEVISIAPGEISIEAGIGSVAINNTGEILLDTGTSSVSVDSVGVSISAPVINLN